MSDERQEHTAVSPWWGEHLHRYHCALEYITPGSKVLDLACGNGFGTQLLSEKSGGEVVGGDISIESIAYCKHTFGYQDNLVFKTMDAATIPYPDAYFDVIVSFETIEHTRSFESVLKEFKRILKPDGTALISTPNIVINSPGGKIINPYHTQEWDYNQLQQLLLQTFAQVKIYGQQYSRYSGKKGFKIKLGHFLENLLYTRGIRKLPVSLQDKVIRPFTGTPMYPTINDYTMVSEPSLAIACKTFFTICKP